jgi:CHAT domain-containing protein/tetratricopeptide (TPR) repeat protein
METTAHDFALALIAADEPQRLLAQPLPHRPLDILVALHQEVLRTWLSDLAYAGRVATLSRLIADQFPDDSLVQAQALWTSGNALLYIPDYAQALDYYDKALIWYEQARLQVAPAEPERDVRVVYNMRIFCLCELGRYSQALTATEQAHVWLTEKPNLELQLTYLLNNSLLAGNMGNYSRMLELATETIRIATFLGDIARQAHGWINAGLACIALEYYDRAEAALHNGINSAKQIEELLTIARGEWNLARLYRYQGQLFNAIGILNTAAQRFAQAANEAATVALEQAALYEQLHQLKEALAAGMRAARSFAALHMPTYSIEAALTTIRIALQYRHASAAKEALALIEAQLTTQSQPVVHAQVQLTQALLALPPSPKGGMPAPRRLQRIRKAVAQALATLQAHQLPYEVAQAQLILARLDGALGQREAALQAYTQLTAHTNQAIQRDAHAAMAALLPPTEALPHLQQAAALVVAQRRALPMEELQARYSSETSPHHQALAGCYLELNQTTRALEAVWEWRAGPLLDLRAIAGQLESTAQAELEAAKADLARLRANVSEQRRLVLEAVEREREEQVQHHTALAEQISQELNEAEQRLTSRMRREGDRTGQAAVPPLPEVQARLAPSMCALEYVQIGGNLGCFVLHADSPPRYYSLCPYELLEPLFDRWQLVVQRMLTNKAHASFQQQIQAVLMPFWKLLLDPLAKACANSEHLLVAPYGLLHNLPWAALLACGYPPAQQPLLTLTPSLGLWGASSPAALRAGHASSMEGKIPPTIPRTQHAASLLGFAGVGERYLPYVDAELELIARHLPDAHINPNATGGDLRNCVAPRILHIAAHGQTVTDSPLSSTIELADGPFLLVEAHRLDLHGTELVVLSACETGTRPEYGEMALALAGAFLCAGARAVVASLWPVSDAAAAQCMELFYAQLARGSSPTAALHYAQQQLRHLAVSDWATFQIWAGAA